MLMPIQPLSNERPPPHLDRPDCHFSGYWLWGGMRGFPEPLRTSEPVHWAGGSFEIGKIFFGFWPLIDFALSVDTPLQAVESERLIFE